MTIPLPPLPDSDGSAEANKTPHPGGGYEFDEIPAWSETLVRAIQREAMRVALEAAARVCRNERLMFGDEEWRVRCDLADEIEALEIGT